MQIEDNGRGLKNQDQYKSHGIVGMRERLETIDRDLMVDGRRGTQLTMAVPLKMEGTA